MVQRSENDQFHEWRWDSMKLEELIYARLESMPDLTKYLARYGRKPAIFYQKAPGDLQTGWQKKVQYPRIIFDLNTQANTERHTAGTLVVTVLCESTGTDPETIAPYVTSSLKDILLNPEESFPVAFAWARSDPFELESMFAENKQSSGSIIGIEIRFDLLEYPEQITTTPDPVVGLGEFIKEEFPDVLVLGLDDIGDITEIKPGRPLIYVRVMDHRTEYQTYSVSWMNCKMAIHIIAPGSQARSRWVRSILNYIAVKGEAIMDGDIPLLFTGSQANNTFDYLATGQITIDTKYGMNRLNTGSQGMLRNIAIRR